MAKTKNNEFGFHLPELGIFIIVISFVGFVGYRVLAAKHKQTSKSSDNQLQSVQWDFSQEDNKWYAKTGAAPKCKEPFVFDDTPVDLSKINVISMPGAYRGYNYKPHGGFRADNGDGHITVKMPVNATLVDLKRYYEGQPAELQYLLTFESDCGIAFRFDHLATLSPAFEAIADKTPKPKANDTSSDSNTAFTRTKFTAGDIIATSVGFPKVKNFGFDFGVYDYRRQNEISKNADWAAIHNQYTSQEWYGVCWLDMFPGEDSTKAKQLASVVLNTQKPNASKVSDYCSQAKYNTLDFNNGQPTDG